MIPITGKHYPVGLDISDLSLKSVQLNKRGKKIKTQALNQLDLPSGIIESGRIVDKNKAIKKVKELWKNPFYGSIKSDRVVASLPDSKSFVKTIRVDNGLNNIVEVIETEIEKHIPYMVDKVYYDWQIIEEGVSSSLVLIGVCPKDISNDYYDVLTKAGLKVEALEVEAVPMARALLKEESPFVDKKESNSKKKNKDAYLIIDLGRTRTAFIVYARGGIVFTADINISGDSITENIADKLNIDPKKAESKKMQYGKKGSGKPDAESKKMIEENFGRINRKAEEIFDFYNNKHLDGAQISKVVLAGGGACLNGVGSFFDSIGAETVLGEAALHLSSREKKIFNKKFGNNSCEPNRTFSTAAGLALGRIFIKNADNFSI
ncbi:MAG: type IV pilus assembly protein PilM [Patescibacteria group bacterium]